ncbi:MAG: L,D-transpeptidase family protein [Rhodoblastus sp.]|nr:L,D-transpeptidase family protein [Rhodoblastus sp.]
MGPSPTPAAPSPNVFAPLPTPPAAPAATPHAAPAPAPSGEAAGFPAPQLAAPKVAKRKPKPKPPIREWALSDDPTPSFQPETFFATAAASERYAKIVDAGGWPKVPGNVGPTTKGPAVAALRRRFTIEGDPHEAVGPGDHWDAQLAAAVKHFQARNGLRQTGVVSGATLRAINTTAQVRFKQLASSSQRLAGVQFPFGERYVVVNIPSAAVEAIENGQVVKRYTAVVGDVDHRSPEVATRISAVNLNPTWTLPTSIIKNEIIPKMRRDPGYLSRSRIKILDGRGTVIDPRSINWSTEKAVNYTLRQDSGTHNALGSIRIQMNNKHAVYMHDTPSKGYFNRDYRFLSHGCVRVQGVYDLAAWLLQGSGNWDRASLMAQIGKDRQDLRLTKPVPVVWVYMTGWASADGVVHFADDVYQVDTIGLQASAH